MKLFTRILRMLIIVMGCYSFHFRYVTKSVGRTNIITEIKFVGRTAKSSKGMTCIKLSFGGP